jgi:hypothetical protein
VQVDQVPTMAALIGHWRTEGEVLGDDGRTVVATVEGSDVYEELGPTVVHRVDVVIGGRRTRALEVVEPYDADRGVFPTRAYDDQGGVEDATATVRDGVWTFSAGPASATLRVAEGGASMSAGWTRPGPDGAPQPWMELRFTRVG